EAAARGDHTGIGAVRLAGRIRNVVLRRGAGCGADPRVGTSPGATRRPVPARCGVLHDERRDERHGVRVRADRCALRGEGRRETRMTERPIVLAITGASGAPYAVRLLDVLARARVPVELLISSHGWRLLETEAGIASDAE